MLIKEQLKEEIWKRVDKIRKYGDSLLREAHERSTFNVVLHLETYYDDIAIRFDRKAIEELYIHVISEMIIEGAIFIGVLKREAVEEYIKDICKILTTVFPQHAWKYVLEKVDKNINEILFSVGVI